MNVRHHIFNDKIDLRLFYFDVAIYPKEDEHEDIYKKLSTCQSSERKLESQFFLVNYMQYSRNHPPKKDFRSIYMSINSLTATAVTI